jgi:hypothetical protein
MTENLNLVLTNIEVMKQILIAILLCITVQVICQDKKEIRKHLLIKAIALRESSYNSDTIVQSENAVGYLGIRPIMVREVNRILRKPKYSLDDRFDRDKSIEMFVIYQNHYNPKWYYCRACRIWNGGPRGMAKQQTWNYWKTILSDGIIQI